MRISKHAKTERQCSKVPKRAANVVNLTHVRQKNANANGEEVELLAISEQNKTQQQDERVLPDLELELIDKELEQLFNNQLVVMNHS